MIKVSKIAILFLSIAHAEISFQAIKEIHAVHENDKKVLVFKDGYQHLSPIWGFLALKTGMIENLRFYGHYDFGWKKEIDNSYTRIYTEDKGQDGITKLVRILFPSTGEAFSTVAVNASNNLGQHMTPQAVSYMLNVIKNLREKTEEKFDIDLRDNPKYKDINRLFFNIQLNGNTHQEKFQDGLKKLFIECLKNEENGLYPKYTTEHILLGFLWSHFNTKNDIKEMYQSLDQTFFNIDVKKIDDTLLCWENVKHYEDNTDLSNKNLEEIIHSIYGIDYFKNPTPYMLGETLISNSETHYYDRSKLGKEGEIKDKKGYADCVEVSQRHLFNFILYDQDKQKFNLNNLEKNLYKIKDWKPNSAFLNMKKWFYGEKQSKKNQSNAGDIETRSAWNSVMGDLNHECTLCEELDENQRKFHHVYYHKKIDDKNDKENRNELHPGLINRINVIEHVLGVRLEIFGDEDQKKNIEKLTKTLIEKVDSQNEKDSEDYQEAYKNYTFTKIKIFFDLAKNNNYEFEINKWDSIFGHQKGSYEDGHPYDRFDSVLNVEGTKDKKNFQFKIISKYEHGFTEFDSKKEDQKNFKTPENFKNSLLDAYLKQSTDFFYKMYSFGPFNSFDDKRVFLEKLINYEKFTENKEKYYPLVQLLLSQLGLDDPHTSEKNKKVIEKIIDFYKEKKDLFKYCASIDLSLFKNLILGRDLSIFDCKIKKYNEIINFNDINSITIDADNMLDGNEKIEKTIFPKALKELNLKKLESIDCSLLEKLDLKSLSISAKKIEGTLSSSILETLHLDFKNEFDFLSAFAVENLKELTIQLNDKIFDITHSKQLEKLEKIELIPGCKEGTIKLGKISKIIIGFDTCGFLDMPDIYIEGHEINELEVKEVNIKTDKILKLKKLSIFNKYKKKSLFELEKIDKEELKFLCIYPSIGKNLDVSRFSNLEEVHIQYKQPLTFNPKQTKLIKIFDGGGRLDGTVIKNGELINTKEFTLTTNPDDTVTLEYK